MYYVFGVIIILACAALIFLVIVQKSKGGGLATNLTGGAAMANQMGVRKATDFVERATWTMIGIIAGLTIIANIFLSSEAGTQQQRQQGPQFETSKALQVTGGGGGMNANQINPVSPQGGQQGQGGGQQAPQGGQGQGSGQQGQPQGGQGQGGPSSAPQGQ
jgi:preprotein translocase subunit SecG